MGTSTEKLNKILLSKNEIKSAIEFKGVTVGDIPFDEYSVKIGEISSGPSSDTTLFKVKWFDYDGTIIKEENVISGDSATPPIVENKLSNNIRPDLTFQDWNISESSYSSVTTDLNIGATYITSNGKTMVYIDVLSATTITLKMNRVNSGTLTIDYGDGTPIITTTSTGNVSDSHTYSVKGQYIIYLSVSDNCQYSIGQSSAVFLTGANESIRYVYVGVNVTSLLSTFVNQIAITYCSIPHGVSSISTQAFYNCKNLEIIIIPKSITTMESMVFYDCFSLKIICFSDTITILKSKAFYQCYALEKVLLYNGLLTIESECFFECFNLDKINIPQTLTSLGYGALQRCHALDSMYLNNQIATIQTSTFRDCHAISTITLPQNLITIGDSVFSNCFSLNEINLPSTITNIGDYTFSECYGIKKYIINSIIPPTIFGTSFNGITIANKIYVPDESLAAYKAANNWSSISNNILPISSL